jgi:hypothetical protein
VDVPPALLPLRWLQPIALLTRLQYSRNPTLALLTQNLPSPQAGRGLRGGVGVRIGHNRELL